MIKKIELLYNIMSKHIGEENGISGINLFIRYFNVSPNYISKYELYYKISQLNHALNYLRRKTNAFVVMKDRKYFIVTNQKEAEQYLNRLKQNRQKINEMIDRCNYAIENKLYLYVGQKQKIERDLKSKNI